MHHKKNTKGLEEIELLQNSNMMSVNASGHHNLDASSLSLSSQPQSSALKNQQPSIHLPMGSGRSMTISKHQRNVPEYNSDIEIDLRIVTRETAEQAKRTKNSYRNVNNHTTVMEQPGDESGFHSRADPKRPDNFPT